MALQVIADKRDIAKLSLELTGMQQQFDIKISALRQEVTEHCQKLTIELTSDAENREKHLEAKLQVVTTNVATQHELYEATRADLKN